MIPKRIGASHVKAAMDELDKSEVPAGRGSTRYLVVHKGKTYPPKYLVCVAAKYAIGRELKPTEFSGGIETNSFLENLGFRIGLSDPGRKRSKRLTRKLPRQGQLIHNERCKACKSNPLILLQKLYGTVETNKQFKIGTTPEAFASTPYASQLRSIFEALKVERGFKDFVRSASLPPCDYYIPTHSFILEFDESQHFTPLRAVALSGYPGELTLGFDRREWMNTCKRIDASDSKPPYRDEQRAWYDTLRDFLPSLIQLNPTVRIYACECAWCELDPNKEEDLKRFRRVLSERSQFWRIEALAAQSPRFARLVMAGTWTGSPNSAQRLLNDIAAAWPADRRVVCLCTCAAFLRFAWPQTLPRRGNRDPDSSEIKILTDAAELVVRSVLSNGVLKKLRACSDYITLGVDTRKEQVSTTSNVISEPHAELVCLVDLRDRSLHWTGKFYPTTSQQRTIVRFPDLHSHFVDLGGEVAMVLGCHDLSVYSPRAQANAGTWRRQIGAEFRSLAKNMQPTVVLQHPHTTVKTRTWIQQWRQLAKDLPCVEHFLGTGAYTSLDTDSSKRDDLHDVMTATQRGDILNIVVRLGELAGEAPLAVGW